MIPVGWAVRRILGGIHFQRLLGMLDNDPNNAPATSCIPRIVMNCALKTNNLNICHVNIQSLCARQMSKFDEFKMCFYDSKIDVICLTETWLTNDVPDSLIEIDGYNIVRNDRKYSRGGGLCVYYRSFLKCKTLSASEIFVGVGNMSRTEFMFLEIAYNSNKFLLGVCYNLPQSDCAGILFDKLSDLSMNYQNILLVGDFNTNLNKSDGKTERLKNCFGFYGLQCVNSMNTHFYSGGSSLIDLFLTNNPDFVENLNQVSAPEFSKHDILFSSIKICRSETEPTRTFRDYRSLNLPSLMDAFGSIDWNIIFSINDADLAVNILNKYLLNLFNSFVPIRAIKPNKNPWFTEQIAHAILERNIAYRLWISDRSSYNHNQFKRLRNRVTLLVNNAKANFLSDNLTSTNSSKDMWKKLKNLNVSRNSQPTVNFDNSNNEINEYFSSNFTTDGELPPIPSENEHGFKFTEIDDNDIIIAINSIKSNAVGLDEIPLRFIKLLFPEICPILRYIFNLIISTSKFPQAWKSSKIIPIQKKGRNTNLNNLRPISILCALSKVFERLLKNQIQCHIENFNLLHQFQSGFRRGHSTTTAFLKVHDDIHSEIDKKGVAFLLLIDFSKAFDKVSHTKLLKKLSSEFLFSRSAVNFIHSYLSRRTQVVFANGSYSNEIPILSGVPQGSILGPLLFSCFINDLPSVLKHCKIHMFADDVQLYLAIEGLPLSVMTELINSDLFRIYEWSNRNLLPVNASKTKAMFISRNFQYDNLPDLFLGTEKLEYIQTVSNLGFIVQDNLEWDKHINTQCGKIFAGLRLLKITSSMLATPVKMQLFKSLLLPHFIYGDVFLLNASALAIDRLRIALNCCVRFVYKLSNFSRVSHLQHTLIGCPFYDFIKMRSCLTLFKIIHFRSPSYLFQELVPFQSTRSRNFVIPRYNSSHYANTLFVRGIGYWDQLPNEIKNINNVGGFQRECVKWFNRRNQQS